MMPSLTIESVMNRSATGIVSAKMISPAPIAAAPIRDIVAAILAVRLARRLSADASTSTNPITGTGSPLTNDTAVANSHSGDRSNGIRVMANSTVPTNNSIQPNNPIADQAGSDRKPRLFRLGLVESGASGIS